MISIRSASRSSAHEDGVIIPAEFRLPAGRRRARSCGDKPPLAAREEKAGAQMGRRESAAVSQIARAEIAPACHVPIGDLATLGADAATIPPLLSAATDPI